jgi:hypothetical protein
MKRDSMDDEVIGAAKMLLRVVPLGKVVPKTFLLFRAHKKGTDWVLDSALHAG